MGMNDMVVLITGASGGFGKVLGAKLAREGWTVYGTARSPEPDPENERPFPMLPKEATDADSIERCVEHILEREGRIDVLINCVNQMIIGSFEEQTADEVKELYDANVFGVLRICQQVLPTMRKQGSGTIVNMSSLGGLLAVPYMSAYTSAKFALEALSEALYHEVKADGIDIVIMQPVAMAMDRPAEGAHLRKVANTRPGSTTHRMVDKMAKDTAASGLTPEAVADEVYRVLTSKKKPLRVPLDRAKPLSLLKRLAPQFVIDRLISGLLDSSPAQSDR